MKIVSEREHQGVQGNSIESRRYPDVRKNKSFAIRL
jgi:hypothetical protein